MIKICVVGLGYVGMPLAGALSEKFSVVGFDINKKRVGELQKGIDLTLELEPDKMSEILKNDIHFSTNQEDIKDCNFFIVTVPTPIDEYKNPDLTPLKSASKTVAEVLKKGDIVVYESTVYPGVTEEICAKVLEKYSNLKFNEDFFCGYSPERINPGDKNHTVTNIKKIISASSDESLETIEKVYSSVIKAGVYRAKSIKVAEAAKVIENTQRDVNIALSMNLR